MRATAAIRQPCAPRAASKTPVYTMPHKFAALVEKKAKAFRNVLNAAETKAFCRQSGEERFAALGEEQAAPLIQWMEQAAGRWLIANGRDRKSVV